jgi:hypothetical protein
MCKKWQAGKLTHGPFSGPLSPRGPPTHRIYREKVDRGFPWTVSYIQRGTAVWYGCATVGGRIRPAWKKENILIAAARRLWAALFLFVLRLSTITLLSWHLNVPE